jgi:ribosomal-protein-alanine N-acetyltransferase
MAAASPSLRLVKLDTGCADDLDSVMAIMTSAFDPRFGEAWSRSQCAGILPLTGVSLTIAREPEGPPLGFALARTVAGEAELLLLAVADGAQGSGIGTILLEAFVADGRTAGLGRLHLEVRDGNRAVEFYRRNGFATVGRRREYYRGTDSKRYDALTMAMELTQ